MKKNSDMPLWCLQDLSRYFRLQVLQHGVCDNSMAIAKGLESVTSKLLQPMSDSLLTQLQSLPQDDRQAWVLLEIYAGSGTHSSWASLAMRNTLIKEGKQPTLVLKLTLDLIGAHNFTPDILGKPKDLDNNYGVYILFIYNVHTG